MAGEELTVMYIDGTNRTQKLALVRAGQMGIPMYLPGMRGYCSRQTERRKTG